MEQVPANILATPESQLKVSEAIGQDHKWLDTCYDNLKAASTTEDKIKWRNMLSWNLARHAISEELTVYPAMERWLGEEGKKLAAEDIAQHQAVKEDLYKLQSMSPESQEFSPLLEQLMHDLHTHIEHEVNEDMPRLEEAMPLSESHKLATQFARTKQFVPTKSHPGAPTGNAIIEGLAGLLAMPLDKLRTMSDAFPEEETGGTEVGGSWWVAV